MDRSKDIIKVSIIGILVNLVLVGAKAAVGALSGSIAIIMDAVNNLSDALSSIITIIGTKIASKSPDKAHPYGHGRVEYLTSMFIAAMVLFAGVSAIKESIDKILHPADVNYTAVTLIVVTMGVLTKYFLGRFVSSRGKKLNSQALIASGADATFDAILSLTTLIAAGINIFFHFAVEGYLGVLIGVVIIKAGLEIFAESVSSIIGARVDSDIANDIKRRINEVPEVLGAYDLILNHYGPELIIGSVHIEVPDDMQAKEIHRITRRISEEIYAEHGIILTVGIYAANTSDPELAAMDTAIRGIVGDYSQVLQMHGFYVDKERMLISFDLIIDFEEEEPEKVKEEIEAKVRELYPDYTCFVILDTDFSD